MKFNNRTSWYSLFVDSKCIFDGKCSYNLIMNKAFSSSKRRKGKKVSVFKGKSIGRFLCNVSSIGKGGLWT
jgi:hypothetical protein